MNNIENWHKGRLAIDTVFCIIEVRNFHIRNPAYKYFTPKPRHYDTEK